MSMSSPQAVSNENITFCGFINHKTSSDLITQRVNNVCLTHKKAAQEECKLYERGYVVGSIGERIKAARVKAGMTQPDLARACGWGSQGRVSNYERGLREPKSSDVTLLARALGVTESYLWTGDQFSQKEHLSNPGRNINVVPAANTVGACPEISWVQAGAWSEVCHVERDPEAITWHPRPTGASETTFVLRVVGESMMPEYMPGTLIYVDPERSAENGKDVVAVLTETGEATFKRFIEEPGHGRMLKALNPDWHEPYIKINGNCRVVGVVVADMRIR